MQFAPRLEFGHAVRAPPPAKKLDHQRPEREQIGRPHQPPRRILQRKLGRRRTHRQNLLLDSGMKEFLDRALAHRHPLRLDEVARVGGNLVELVLERGHGALSATTQRSGYLRAYGTHDSSKPSLPVFSQWSQMILFIGSANP